VRQLPERSNAIPGSLSSDAIFLRANLKISENGEVEEIANVS
jgi:hypothetical protein